MVNFDLKRRVERFDRLKKIKETYTELLTKKRETMRKLAEAVGSDDSQTLALRQQYALEHLQYLQKELLGIQSQRRKAEAQARLRGPAVAGEPRAEPAPLTRKEIDRLVDEHPDVAALAAELAEQQQLLDSQKATARRVARTAVAEPSVRALEHAVKALRQSLDRCRKDVRPEVMRQAEQQLAVDESTLGDDLADELKMLVDLEERLRGEIDAIKAVDKTLTSKTLDLQSDREDLEQMELAANKVAQEVEALTVELEAPRGSG